MSYRMVSMPPQLFWNIVPPEFLEVFNRADVIISKGQGNLEGLLGKTDKAVYYLLMVKCEVIADALSVPVNSFVTYKPQLINLKSKN